MFDDSGTDQIYVSGLPLDVTEEELAQHFGQIGRFLVLAPIKGSAAHWLHWASR